MLKPTGLLATALLLASPVAAGENYYRYETETSIAFTDDPETIPERYRDSMRMIEAQSLFEYERTSIAREDAGQEAPSRPETVELDPSQAAALGTAPSITLEVAPGVYVDVPVPAAGDEEQRVNVERGWVQRDGTLYPYTRIKQGDKILVETLDRPVD